MSLCDYYARELKNIHDDRTILQQIMSVKDINWENLETRLKSYPSEAAEKDRFGVTSLHHAIRKRHCSVPIHIIKLLIEAHPPSLEIRDEMTGCNALHMACLNSDSTSKPDLVQMVLDASPISAYQCCNGGRLALHMIKNKEIGIQLIERNPQGVFVKAKNCGWLPIHYACSDNQVPVCVVKILIAKGRELHVDDIDVNSKSSSKTNCGGLLIKDVYGDIPLQILLRKIQFSESFYFSDKQLWEKLCFITKATCTALNNNQYSEKEVESISLTHAFIECGGHPRTVRQALTYNPQQVMQRDSRGRTPLSIAAARVSTHPEMFRLLLSAKDFGCKDAAQLVDCQGRLPLHLAVESGRTWNNGVRVIADAFSEAMEIQDKSTGMYAFQLAAMPTFRWDNTCIDTIYSLLREAPHVLKDIPNRIG